jgi:hypothetical protein
VLARLKFLLNRTAERLWVRPLAMCVVSIAGAFLAKAADRTSLADFIPAITSESIETLLTIMASSMLVIATFAVASMVSAYASASATATPRTFSLVVADDVSQSPAVCMIAFETSGCAATPLKSLVAYAIRRPDFFGGSAFTRGRAASRASHPINADSESRTLRLRNPLTERSPGAGMPGRSTTRPRDGFNPKMPQLLAGTRMEPPPSLPCAIGTMPAATAAPVPPLDPPGEYSRFQGFKVGPNANGSVLGSNPNSGVAVFPKTTIPILSIAPPIGCVSLAILLSIIREP